MCIYCSERLAFKFGKCGKLFNSNQFNIYIYVCSLPVKPLVTAMLATSFAIVDCSSSVMPSWTHLG